MSWIWAALMPHPPVLVPEVGRGREREAGKTLEGLERLTASLGDKRPDLLLLLSPHQPYAPGALFLNTAERPRGTLAPFGAPSVVLEPVASPERRKALAVRLAGAGTPVREGSRPDLTADQGSLVPLYFLLQAWGTLPPVVLASPIGLTPRQALSMGEHLAGFDDGLRWGLVASGDLSHRLIPGAPAGYSSAGRVFDGAVLEALKSGDAGPLIALSPETLDAAGECGLRSVLAMLGLCRALSGAPRVLSYEGPFGVGYCNALWEAPGGAPVEGRPGAHPCARLARETVARLLGGRPLPRSGSEVASSELWAERRACFVSIKSRSGALRGCIGTLAPAERSLDREIIANAVSASTRDPRFPPMTAGELADAVFSVDVLADPEPVAGLEALDPKVWGVIVSKGGRRGVLLPDLEGVDTVEAQLSIAMRKAGIADPEGMAVERFRVDRYGEDGRPGGDGS